MKGLSAGKKRLLDYLGKPYTTKTIDLENCVYLDMGNYDIEILGGKTVCSKFHIYIWRKNIGFRIVERHMDVANDLSRIKGLLDDIRSRYENKE